MAIIVKSGINYFFIFFITRKSSSECAYTVYEIVRNNTYLLNFRKFL